MQESPAARALLPTFPKAPKLSGRFNPILA